MEFGNSNDKIIKLDSAEDKNSTPHGKETKSRSKALIGKGLERKGSTVEAKSKALVGSLGKNKSDIISISKKSTGTTRTIQKGKSEKEEEKRKKMEELLAQRQKRITERSASTAKTAKSDKPKAQAASQDMKKSNKPVIRSSTIDRLSAARVTNPKVLPTESKPGNKPRKVTTKENGVSLTSFSPKMVGAEKKKVKPEKVEHLDKNIGVSRVTNPKVLPTESKPCNKPRKVTTKENSVLRTSFSPKMAGAGKKEVKPEKVKHLDKNIGSKNSSGPKKKIADLNNVKRLHGASPIKKVGNGVARHGSSAPPNYQSGRSAHVKGLNKTLHKESSVLQEDIPLSDGNADKTLHRSSMSANKALNSVSFRINEDRGAKENPIVKVNREIHAKEISAPSPGKGSPERSNFRKKWSNGETSTKALIGLRKLLSFGRS